MDAPFADVCCACVPAAALGYLAPLRAHAIIRIRIVGEKAWLWWTAEDAVVRQRIAALHGAELFARRGEQWYRPGQHIPAFDVPDEDEARPLIQVLTPAPVSPESGEPSIVPSVVGLVRDDRPRDASAMCCSLLDLSRWAERATSQQLAALEAIYAGECVLLRGGRLPPLTAGERYWGREILIPLGFRLQPEMSEGVLREALRLQAHEIALVNDAGFEPIDARLFATLTRAGVRLAARR